ncbi:DUF2917 domain-containing protein [Paraburkholderia sp. DHOC27]|uniref:DUF2917 domain-containing protein n=1 Tax=Paraburkholderia sp. DHOC27 TaxID=2303330 RepID=UPI0015F2F2C7|nr:DUF2917 domain-containing protein [Paraburkholderia sp. DHOC27]
MQDAIPPLEYSSLTGSPPGRDGVCVGVSPKPRLVIHLALAPGQTLSWRVKANSEIRAFSSRVWLTRICSSYDYWLRPGELVRVARGERVWLSAEDDAHAEVTLTCDYPARGAWLDALLSRSLGRGKNVVVGVFSALRR